jgi:flagella basal body P-ring formation protein FlgA
LRYSVFILIACVFAHTGYAETLPAKGWQRTVTQQLAPYLQPGDHLTLTALNPTMADALDEGWQFQTLLGIYWSPRFIVKATKAGQTRSFPVRAELTRQVYVTTQPVPANTLLTSTPLKISYQPVQTGANWLSATADISHQVTRLPLAANSPIDVKKLALQADVQAHQPVTLEVESDGVLLSMQGVAMTQGVIGQQVSVQQVSVKQGKRNYYGIVTQPNHVRVKL